MSNPGPPYQFLADKGNLWKGAISEHTFSNGHDPLGLSAVSVSQIAPCWDRHASNCVPQAFEDTRDEHHQSTSDAGAGAGASLQHDMTAPVFLEPRSANQSPGSEFWSPRLEQDSSGTLSPSTISSGTVSGQSVTKPGINLKILQYSPSRTRKTLAPKRDPAGKPSKKGRSYGQSSRPDALKTDMVRSHRFSTLFIFSKFYNQAPKVLVKLDVKGDIAGTERVFGLSQVVRATASKELQHATSITRRIGACSRCRRQRTRVSAAVQLLAGIILTWIVRHAGKPLSALWPVYKSFSKLAQTAVYAH
jgi:hypothetical protein